MPLLDLVLGVLRAYSAIVNDRFDPHIKKTVDYCRAVMKGVYMSFKKFSEAQQAPNPDKPTAVPVGGQPAKEPAKAPVKAAPASKP
jgi:hypothetical protein